MNTQDTHEVEHTVAMNANVVRLMTQCKGQVQDGLDMLLAACMCFQANGTDKKQMKDAFKVIYKQSEEIWAQFEEETKNV